MHPPQTADRDKCTLWLKRYIAVMKPNHNLMCVCSISVYFNINYTFVLQLLVNACESVCVHEMIEKGNVTSSPCWLWEMKIKDKAQFDVNLAVQFIIMPMSMGVVLSQGSLFSLCLLLCLSVCFLSVWTGLLNSSLFYPRQLLFSILFWL